MSDVNANISVNIDTSTALAELKSLQRQLALFHSSVAKSSAAAQLAQGQLQRELLNTINATGKFAGTMVTIKSSTESFTHALETNKLGMRDYFRYAGASTKTFGKLFQNEFNTIGKVAEDRVKTMQTQYIKMGRDANGAMKAMAIRPLALDMNNFGTQTQIAAQRQALFNQLLKQGSTNLLNFGKNTQWAGRQLMVGFTIPLIAVATQSTKTFMDMETQALKFKKVYGDLFTTQAETQQALKDIQDLSKSFTQYGISAASTVGLAADAAAAGFKGLDLQRQTEQATRLSVLGQIDQQQALQTTIALQNAFSISSADLADNINFLNAVENQTVLSLDDITTAIPKVAPVIQQLGGNVKDLAFFLTAMKEGGVNASEGANALKSGLASLINPTNTARKMLSGLGIDIVGIVQKDKGNLKQTVVDFAKALDTLAPLQRAQAIEQMFGKFQFARLSALFSNVTKDGTQASRVLDLANASVGDLANTANKELGITAQSAMFKFKKSVEDLKIALQPIGETFLKTVTPVIDFFRGILDRFSGLSDGAKKFITVMIIGVGALAPVLLMLVGLFANLVANGMKGATILRNAFLRLTGQSRILAEQTTYLNAEQLQAATVAASLNQSHTNLTQTFTIEAEAVNALRNAYLNANLAATEFSARNPGMMLPKKGRGYASGIVSVPGPKGAGDVVPAMLSPGEAVIPTKMVQKYAPLIQGMIANNIPGYADGRAGQLPLYPEYAMRLQNKSQNMAKGAGRTNLNEILSPLTARIGEARGLAPTQSRVATGAFDTIATQFESVTQQFTDKLNSEFETTFAHIKNVDERFSSAWTSAGKSVEQEVNKIQSDVDRGVVRKTFGLDPDVYGTIPTAPRREGGNVPQRARKGAFLSRKTGVRSYTNISGGAKAIFARRTGTSAEDLQMGHVNGPQMISIDELQANPNKSSAVALAAKTMSAGQTALEKAAQTESPSKKAKQVGNDISQGLALGMKEGSGKVVKEAKNLGGIATDIRSQKASDSYANLYGAGNPVTATDKSIRRNQSKTMADISRERVVSKTFIANATLQEKAMRVNAERLAKMNSVMMNGTFALTGLAAAGSMAGGALGSISNQIMKFSGLLYALMLVTQLVTQTKIAELATNRLAMAKQVGAFASYGSGLSSKAGILGSLSRFGLLIKTFLGPIGLATTGLMAAYMIIKKVNSIREEEANSLQAFGNSLTNARLASDKLANSLGYTPTKSPYLQNTSIIPVKQETRSAVETLIASDQFKSKEVENLIKSIKSVKDSDIKRLLTMAGFGMVAQGASKDAVQTFITAILEQAGKTDLNFDFKSIKFSKDNIDAIQSELSGAFADLGKAYRTGTTTSYQRFPNESGGFRVEKITEKSSKAENEMKSGARTLSEFNISIGNALQNSQISVDAFKKSFNKATEDVITNTPDAAAAVLLFNQTLALTDKTLANQTAGIKDLNAQLLIMKSKILGVAITQQFIDTMKSGLTPSNDSVLNAEYWRNYQAQQDLVNKQLEGFNKNFKETQNNNDTIKTGTNALKDRVTALQQQNKVFALLRKSQIDYSTAQELSADSEMRAMLLSAQSAGLNSKKWKDAIGLVRTYAAENKKLEQALIAGQDQGDYEKTRLEMAQNYIALQEHLIDMQNKPQLNTYQTEIDKVNTQLDTLKIKEDQINSSYDQQIAALSKVKSLNENVLNLQKQRLDVANALTSGDISAAVSAIQQARSQQASTAMSVAEGALGAGKENAIAALGRVTLEKQLSLLQQQQKALQDNIQAEKDRIKWLGMTKDQIDDAVKALDLAKNANIDINDPNFLNNILQGAKGDADSLAKALAQVAIEAKKAFTDIASLRSTSYGMGTITGGGSSYIGSSGGTDAAGRYVGTPFGQAPTTIGSSGGYDAAGTYVGSGFGQAMYGGFIKKMAPGGVVRGSGMTDKIPTLLTPGEYVVNKNAANKFGPLLQQINDSKYPSSLSFATTPMMATVANSATNNNTAVYNYSLSVSANTDGANPDDIARTVITHIRNMDAQRIRSNK